MPKNIKVDKPFWNHMGGESNMAGVSLGQLHVPIYIGKYRLDLIFSRRTVENHFLPSGDTLDSLSEAERRIEEVIKNEPVFKKIILEALENQEVQKNIQDKKVAHYLVLPEYFGYKNYRLRSQQEMWNVQVGGIFV